MAWYRARNAQAARRFEDAVAAAVGRIGTLPELYALEGVTQRLCPVTKFRYVLVYEYDPTVDEVVIVTLANPTQDAPPW